MTRPVRLQLSRTPGFRLQVHSRQTNGLDAVKVDRTTQWGNPFAIDAAPTKRMLAKWDWKLKPGHWDNPAGSATEAVHRFEACLAFDGASHWLIRRELRFQNLACWCRLCDMHRPTGKPFGEHCPNCAPCHADVIGAYALTCEAEP